MSFNQRSAAIPSSQLNRRLTNSRGRPASNLMSQSNLGMPNFKYQQQFYESQNKGNVIPSFQDRLESKLS